MRLQAEFTVEPFVEGAPGPHVTAAFAAVRADGLDTEFGPFGTTVIGERTDVLDALDAAIRVAFENGAKRFSVQVTTASSP